MLKLLLFVILTLKLLLVQAYENSQCFRLVDETCPNANITFWLYSLDRPFGHKLNLSDFQIDFDIATPLKLLLHDFGGNRQRTPNKEIRPELISFRHLTVISVDYRRLVAKPCYVAAVHNLPFVGRCVAQFLAELMNNELLLPQNLHIIGFGLGAHLANYVANNLKAQQLRVGHITGLDPPKPLFLEPNSQESLDASDADFVDVIHTDIFTYGIVQPLGHVDFYPNMGVMQPYCGPLSESSSHACYHEKSAVYYAESIFSTENFWSFRCASLLSFVNGSCKPLADFELLGHHVSPFARGIYFLATNDKQPYAKGKNFQNMDRSLAGKTYMGDYVARKLKQMKAGSFETLIYR